MVFLSLPNGSSTQGMAGQAIKLQFDKGTLRGPRKPCSSHGSLVDGDKLVLTKAATQQLGVMNGFLKTEGYGFELDESYTSKFPFQKGRAGNSPFGNGYEFAFISKNKKLLWRKAEGNKPGGGANYVFVKTPEGRNKFCIGDFISNEMNPMNLANNDFVKNLAKKFYAETISLLVLSSKMKPLTLPCQGWAEFEERFLHGDARNWKALENIENDFIIAIARACLRK